MCVCCTFRSSDFLLFVKNGFVLGVRTLNVTAASATPPLSHCHAWLDPTTQYTQFSCWPDTTHVVHSIIRRRQADRQGEARKERGKMEYEREGGREGGREEGGSSGAMERRKGGAWEEGR